MKARAQKTNWSPDVEVLLFQQNGRYRDYVTNLVMTHEDESSAGKIIEPTFHLSYEEAQQLMDDLWQCGLRPSEGTGSAGALAATQKHLEDMRKLVFKDA